MSIIARALSGVVAVAMALGPAAAAGASELPEPTVEVSDGTTILKFSVLTTKQTFVKKDGTTQASPTAAPAPGDKFEFDEELRQGETLIGTDSVTCVTETEVVRCIGDFTFAGGTIRATGTSPVDEEGAKFAVALTSGTGKYTGISGKGEVVNLDETHANVVLEYRTPEQSAQVTRVPSGGAAAGGGHGSAQQSLALLGVGAVVALAGARLFLAGRRP